MKISNAACYLQSRRRYTIDEKSAQRDANTARALDVVRFGHRPPARPLSQTHRQDRLQYTAPQNERSIQKLIVSGKEITEVQDIAEELNKYFF